MINTSALKAVLKKIQQNGIEEKSLNELYRFLISSQPEELISMNPNYIAEQCSIKRIEMLNLVIQGLTKSLFEMNWDISCTLCQDVVEQSKLLAGIKHTAYCERCETEFENFADENITVTVSLHPSLFEKAPVISARHKIADHQIKPLYALELAGLPAFRASFHGQVPDLDESIKIRSMTVVFTDLIQSTSLYDSFGDLNAYALIKEHFNILFDNIILSSGGIIKTIGDAVLAFFNDPVTAVKVSFELKQAVEKLFADKDLHGQSGLRVGISAGPALIVNFNNNLDLFGMTINLASRIVNFADADSIAVSLDLMKDKKLNEYLKSMDYQILTSDQDIKGIPDIKTINLITPKKGQ